MGGGGWVDGMILSKRMAERKRGGERDTGREKAREEAPWRRSRMAQPVCVSRA